MLEAFGSRRFVFATALAAVTLVACGPREDNAFDTSEAPGTVALPNDSATMPATAMGEIPTTDAGAVDFLTSVDSAEIEAGNLAKTKASSSEVKNFAQQMVTEHTNDLKKLAAMNVTDSAMAAQTSTIVTSLKAQHDQAMNDLRNLSGAEFDRQYMTHQVNDHQKVLNVLQQMQNRVQNSELQQHLNAATSAVQQHLDKARTIQSNLGTSGAPKDTSR